MRTFWLILILSTAAACGGKEPKAADKSYQQTKESLADKEKKNPVGFLTIADQHDKKTLFGIGGQTIVKGTITNVASVCTYKDVRVKLLCFNTGGTMLEEHEDVMNEVIAPGSSTSYRVHYKLPKETDSIALSIMSATPVLDTARR